MKGWFSQTSNPIDPNQLLGSSFARLGIYFCEARLIFSLSRQGKFRLHAMGFISKKKGRLQMKRFVHKMRVRMYDTDAAGILYFADQFRFTHDAFETFFGCSGCSIPVMVAESPIITPAVHASTDFIKALKAGMHIEVSVQVERLGTTSIALVYNIAGDGGLLYGRARIVYVFVCRKTFTKCPIPFDVRTKLEDFMSSP